MVDPTLLDVVLAVDPVLVFIDALRNMTFDNASAAIERVDNEGGALLLSMAIRIWGDADDKDVIVDHTVSESYSRGEDEY